LKLTDTLTGEKKEFTPLTPGRVSLYVCGVTVYDDCHIGHARGAVVFDVLRRWLERGGLRVTHVRNITDVDDKIIARARAEAGPDLKAAVRAVAERSIASFQSDFSKLGLLKPHYEPKATEAIQSMQELIGELMKRGAAYEAADGVYFAVRKLAQYGALSHQKLDQMLEGEKEAGEGKRDALDFALWKRAKPDEPAWDSPWGPGRPGWHIECTAMSTERLGPRFDIHGGGQDLIFPHHENELAQALGVGRPFARTWVHNGLLTVNGQKMAKSVGNVVRIGDALNQIVAPYGPLIALPDGRVVGVQRTFGHGRVTVIGIDLSNGVGKPPAHVQDLAVVEVVELLGIAPVHAFGPHLLHAFHPDAGLRVDAITVSSWGVSQER